MTEAQMKALFGEGRHPDGVQKRGAAYPVYANLAPYQERIAERVAEFASLNGRPPSAAERNRIAAVEARRGRRAVAGFDLVFTPVKSASVLWALGGVEVRHAVEDAHHEAVAGTIGWLEQHAAYSRIGRGGVAQIDTTGLICAMFDHRESRAGDPDLHTHVAVANKVCGVDGKWRSLDARGLYALGVAASERYNTRFEDALARWLGVEFVERPGGSRDLRPVREIDDVPLELVDTSPGAGRRSRTGTPSCAATTGRPTAGSRTEPPNCSWPSRRLGRPARAKGPAAPWPSHRPDGSVDDWFRLRAGDVVLVDEAGVAGTLQLRDPLTRATESGATVRLLGDPAQLAAVDAGGALQLLEREVGATHLTTLHRFTDPDEGAATLALRNGAPEALAFYSDRNRSAS